jgi:Flp pilus assembly protein TadD
MAATKTKTMRKVAANPSLALTSVPTWLLASLLALTTIALYWPALQNGFVNYDDDRYVTANAHVQHGLNFENTRWAFLNSVADNWHPLTVLSHMLVCQFCGLNPWGHHLASVLLHAANAALVFILLRQLTGSVWKSFFVAALFAVHPLRVESVAWVAERKDVLSGFFGLLALIFYARYAQGQNPNGDHKKVGSKFFFSRPYWIALFCFALGLMSKPMLVTWPFVMLLLDFWPLNRFSNLKSQISNSGPLEHHRPSLSKLILEKVPFLVLATAVSAITFVVQKQCAAMETMQNLPLAARFENALISYCRYLGKTFWPTDLAVFYPHPGHWPMSVVLLTAGFLASLFLLLVVLRRQHPYLLMGWLWFLGMLVPVIGLVQVGLQSMADRYTYLPSLGILILVIWGADALTRRWMHQAILLAIAGSAWIAVCMTLTRTQLTYWQDSETIFRHTINVTEANSLAHYNLATALDDKGRRDDAIHEYQAVLQTDPTNTLALLNLGDDLYRNGEVDDAVANYQQVVLLEPNNEKAHNNLGIVFFKKGQNDEAKKEFQEAIRLAPDNAPIHNSLAVALYIQGQTDKSIQEFQEALRLQPNYPEVHFNLGCILAKNGQTDEAIKHFQEAIRLKPDYSEARDRLTKLSEAQGK